MSRRTIPSILCLLASSLVLSSARGEDLTWTTCSSVAPACDEPTCTTFDVPYCDPCQSCAECCGSCWTLTADALFLRRGSPPDQPLTQTGGDEPQWNASDLGTGFRFGPRVSLRRQLGTRHEIEFNYFGIYSLDAIKERNVPNFGFVSTPEFPPFSSYFVGMGDLVRFEYDSKLNSGEVNLRRQCSPWLSVLAGFRWMELSEEFNNSLNGDLVYAIGTVNHLYGLQLGADVYLFRSAGGRFHLDLFAKGGIYGNHVNVDGFTTGAAFTNPGAATGKAGRVAFVGEVGVAATFALNDWLSLRGGYQMLCLDGVALAPHQLPNMSTDTGIANPYTALGAFYHGGFCGFVAEF